MLVVDTVEGLGFVVSRAEGNRIINAQEASEGSTLTGTVEAGSTIVVKIEGTSYDAVVAGPAWSPVIGAGVVGVANATFISWRSRQAHMGTPQVSRKPLLLIHDRSILAPLPGLKATIRSTRARPATALS